MATDIGYPDPEDKDRELLDFDEFEWDPEKAASNLVSHGISFDDAAEAVENAVVVAPGHKCPGELRLVVTGHTSMGRTLDVVITMRGRNVRIISARRYVR